MFKITIEKTEVETALTQREFTTIGDEEVVREDSFAVVEGEPKTRIKPVYGYSPQIETKKEVTRTIYEQLVDELDLVRVIAAVNWVGGPRKIFMWPHADDSAVEP